MSGDHSLPRRLKPGVELLGESPGEGSVVEKHYHYELRLRIWLRRGEPVRWPEAWGQTGGSRLDDQRTALTMVVRIDRVSLIGGLFYGVEGMRVGGTRTLRIAPHLAYGEQGVPGVIPPKALLTVEVTVLAHRPELHW